MNVMKRIGMLACVALLGIPVTVLAQQPGSGMKQDHQMGGMQQQGMGGMGMMEMCQEMQETAQDCKMMDGMKGQHQLMSEMKKHLREMKKHMQMMDEKMDEMMEGIMGKMMMPRGQGMGGGMTPQGGGSEKQEHHPAQDR